MTAPEESPAAFLRRFLDTYERGDLDTLWTFYDDACRFPVLERYGIEPTRDAYRTFMRRFLEAFPDVHHHIEQVVSDGDHVWALYTMTGTHRGPLRGMAPTGRSVRYSIVAMYRVAGGRITEADFLADELERLRQLGALPEG